MYASLNYLDPQTILRAMDAVLAFDDEIPEEDALSNMLSGMNSDEFGGYYVD